MKVVLGQLAVVTLFGPASNDDVAFPTRTYLFTVPFGPWRARQIFPPKSSVYKQRKRKTKTHFFSSGV